jgi:hypothetical protein
MSMSNNDNQYVPSWNEIADEMRSLAIDLRQLDDTIGVNEPPPPPKKIYRRSWFCGPVETKESKRAMEDWRVYMMGWDAGFKSGRMIGERNGSI